MVYKNGNTEKEVSNISLEGFPEEGLRSPSKLGLFSKQRAKRPFKTEGVKEPGTSGPRPAERRNIKGIEERFNEEKVLRRENDIKRQRHGCLRHGNKIMFLSKDILVN